MSIEIYKNYTLSALKNFEEEKKTQRDQYCMIVTPKPLFRWYYVSHGM